MVACAPVPFNLTATLPLDLTTTASVTALANGRLMLSVYEVVREKKKKGDARVEILTGTLDLVSLVRGSMQLEEDVTLKPTAATASGGATPMPPMHVGDVFPGLRVVLTTPAPLLSQVAPEVCANILDVSACGTCQWAKEGGRGDGETG